MKSGIPIAYCDRWSVGGNESDSDLTSGDNMQPLKGKSMEEKNVEEKIGAGVGGVAGTAAGVGGGVAAVSSAGAVAGLSGPGIMSGLASIGLGSVVGGLAVVSVGTVAAAGAFAYGGYKLAKWLKNRKSGD